MLYPNSYPFDYLGGENNVYFFVTQNNIAYEVKFKPFSYLFKDKLFSSYTYEFVIEVYSNPTGHTPPFDGLMGVTIAAIFDEFYALQTESITIYICDTSDSKHWARQRKFSAWFLPLKMKLISNQTPFWRAKMVR
jgi:Family of unknown function (DUF6169)